MKKFNVLLTVMLLIALVVPGSVSATVIPTGPDGVVWYDPVTYEAPLSEFPAAETYTSGITYMHYSDFPENLTYVSDGQTPVGTGYLSHTYDANDANVSKLLQFNVGEKKLAGFADIKDKSSNVIGTSYMPGSIGKQKAELVFRITDFGGIAMSSSSLSNVFDFRLWKANKDGTYASQVMGLQVSASGTDDLAWKTTLTSTSESTRGEVNKDTALHLNTWYRANIVTDFATSYQQGYIEKWDAATNSWVNLRTLFAIDGTTGRTLEEMGIFCVSSSARVRISNKLGFDIAQARIIKDNIMVYQSNPADATTASAKIALKSGVKTSSDGTNIVATTYIAGNAFGKDGSGNPTTFFEYANGAYEPRTLKPVLIVAQYDDFGGLEKVDVQSVDLATLKSGYRANGTNFCDYTKDETADGEVTTNLQKSLEYKKLEVTATKSADTAYARVYMLTGFDKIIPLMEAIDVE